MPKVLIADDLSQAAVDIFTNRGIETDIKVGLSKDELIAIVDQDNRPPVTHLIKQITDRTDIQNTHEPAPR